MAKNRKFPKGNQLSLVCTDPATPAPGDPVLFGQVPGVALTAEGASIAGETTVQTDGVFDLSVKGIDNVGNAAIAAGDIIYYDTATTPKLSADAVGTVRFGYALAAVTSGATATIPVKVGY